MVEKELDEIIIEIMKEVTPYKWRCRECGSEFFRKVFEDKILELLETEDSESENHLLFQIDRASELAYWECPECENPVDFSGNGGRYQ